MYLFGLLLVCSFVVGLMCVGLCCFVLLFVLCCLAACLLECLRAWLCRCCVFFWGGRVLCCFVDCLVGCLVCVVLCCVVLFVCLFVCLRVLSVVLMFGLISCVVGLRCVGVGLCWFVLFCVVL